MFVANYPRIEARYHSVDLTEMPLRRCLNFAFEFIVDALAGSEQWEKDWAPLFDPNAEEDSDVVDLPSAGPGQLSFGL